MSEETIMRIKFVNPNNKKFGTIEHVENVAGRALIVLGEVEEVPWKDFRERLQYEETQRKGTRPGDVDASLPKGEVTWGNRPANGSTYSKPLILKRVGAELLFYDSPPADCPLAIAQEHARLLVLADPVAAENAAEATLQRKLAAEREEKQARKGVDPEVNRWVAGQLVK